jgi:hypothetical protein
MAAHAPAGSTEVGAGGSHTKQVPYTSCQTLGALRWLLMNYQGDSVRPYSLRALAYVSPIVVLAAALAVRAIATLPGLASTNTSWLRSLQHVCVETGLHYEMPLALACLLQQTAMQRNMRAACTHPLSHPCSNGMHAAQCG